MNMRNQESLATSNCHPHADDSSPENACNVCITASTALGIQRLNSQCFCLSLPDGALKQALKVELAVPEVFDLIEQRCPHLFSAQPVFVSSSQQRRMAALITAIETVVALPSFRDKILSEAPIVAQHRSSPALGVFFGYDFHLHDEKLGLIEVNTNAGGAMLNAILARAQHACCTVMADIVHSAATVKAFEENIIAMFRREWQLSQEHQKDKQGQERELRTIAIVDDAPSSQYLYPEFLLFQQLFTRFGMQAVIAAPDELRWEDAKLWYGETCIDLVYNRLTDFYLDDPKSSAVRQAYLADAIVLTPHPQAHALYADKRNLAIWSDPEQLQALGVDAETQACLIASIPRTEPVRLAHAERLWANRRHLFFKPNAGYGGRAAYRGDKITKRVWEEILAGDYIAQEIITPGERVAGTPETPEHMKFDIRQYTYDGKIQWTAARLYQGQTTNFRTPGGGFAPVYVIDDEDLNNNRQLIETLLASTDK